MRGPCLVTPTLVLIIISIESVESAHCQNEVPLGDPMPAQIDYRGELRGPFPPGQVVETVTFTQRFVLPPSSMFGFLSRNIEFTGATSYSFQLPRGCRRYTGAPLKGSVPFKALASIRSVTSSGAEPLAVYILPSIRATFGAKCRYQRKDVFGLFPVSNIGTGRLTGLKVVDRFKTAYKYRTLRASALLSLACPVRAAGPGDGIKIDITPPDGQPWPLQFDHTKSDAEIAALKTVPGGMNAGLTVAKLPKIEINWAATSAGSLRGHACPFIESIVIKFPDIQMYVDKKYATDSCEFRETRAHEEKHYKGFAATLRTYQTDLRERLRALYLPMQARPIFASNIETATGKIDNAISAEIHQSIDSLREQLKQETTLLDRESSAVHARCTNW